MQAIYAQRRSRLLKILSGQGIERVMIGKPNNIYYYTGIMITPYERFVALLLDGTDNSCAMILPGVDKNKAAAQGLTELVYRDDEDPLLKIQGLVAGSKILGVEMDYFPMNLGEEIRQKLTDIKVTNISKFIQKQRLFKEPEEIELISRAVQYGDQTLGEIKDLFQVGRSEKEIQFALLQAMSHIKGINTDQFVIQVLGGVGTANPHGYAGDYVLQKGDALAIDYGVYYERYWSDYCRTFFLGEPDPQLKEIYHIVLEAQTAAINLIRPGVVAKEIDLAARNVIEKAGYGAYFLHRLGHGIGLDIHEAPYIHMKNDDMIEKGMVFTVEPGIYLPHLGGVRIEDDVLVTEDGVRVLNHYPKDYQSMVLK
jgi:Xaa-Pro dipeptidase